MEQLTCVIPKLLIDLKDVPKSVYQGRVDCKNVEILLSRSRRNNMEVQGSVGLFAKLLNLNSAQLAVAPISRLGDGGTADDQWWARLDPVYLQTDRDSVVMMGNACLDISLDEAHALALELSHHFSDLGWHIEVLHPKRWYLRLPEPPNVITHEPHEVQGKHVFAYLPSGEKGRQWHGLLNEMQMLLHASPVNQVRQSQGKLPINGLWLWGEGKLTSLKGFEGCLYGGGAFERGIAKLANIPMLSGIADYEALMERGGEGRHAIVYLDDLEQAFSAQNLDQWIDVLNKLEHSWFSPIRRALKANQLKKVTLYAGGKDLFESTAKDQRRFWKRRQSLLDYVD